MLPKKKNMIRSRRQYSVKKSAKLLIITIEFHEYPLRYSFAECLALPAATCCWNCSEPSGITSIVQEYR